MKLLLEYWREYLKESVAYVSIDKVLPTEELGHGKDHECPSQACEAIIQSKMAAIKQGEFEPIQVCNQKPVVTAKLAGQEDYIAPPKSEESESFFYVLDGHHRLEAAKRLGLKKIPITKTQK